MDTLRIFIDLIFLDLQSAQPVTEMSTGKVSCV